ncbi:phenylalanine--tRNA ligase subunit beta, partial [Patescibacteria group bacterium]|nr:phenylalanine--tRNA ligase subunit beta [Patescibacteria group bacterium]
QFPSIERDIAIEVDWDVKWGEIKNEILKQIQDDIFNKIEFLSEFDLGNKKSLAFRITYQADKTLKDKEVEVVENKIIRLLEKKFGAKLRS